MESRSISHSVFALKERTRRALSPWIQRRLKSAPGLPARRSPTLTTRDVHRLRDRAQRRTERATVWKPDVGALKPVLVQRFSRAVAARFQAPPLVGVRRAPVQPADHWIDDVELALSAGPTTGAARETQRPRSTPGGPPTLTAGQRIEPMRTGTPIPRMSTRPKQVQRSARKPPPKKPPTPGTRLYSRVEEVTQPSTSPEPVQRTEEPQDEETDIREGREEPELVMAEEPSQAIPPAPAKETKAVEPLAQRATEPHTAKPKKTPPKAKPVQRKAALPQAQKPPPITPPRPPEPETDELPIPGTSVEEKPPAPTGDEEPTPASHPPAQQTAELETSPQRRAEAETELSKPADTPVIRRAVTPPVEATTDPPAPASPVDEDMAPPATSAEPPEYQEPPEPAPVTRTDLPLVQRARPSEPTTDHAPPTAPKTQQAEPSAPIESRRAEEPAPPPEPPPVEAHSAPPIQRETSSQPQTMEPPVDTAPYPSAPAEQDEPPKEPLQAAPLEKVEPPESVDMPLYLRRAPDGVPASEAPADVRPESQPPAAEEVAPAAPEMKRARDVLDDVAPETVTLSATPLPLTRRRPSGPPIRRKGRIASQPSSATTPDRTSRTRPTDTSKATLYARGPVQFVGPDPSIAVSLPKKAPQTRPGGGGRSGTTPPTVPLETFIAAWRERQKDELVLPPVPRATPSRPIKSTVQRTDHGTVRRKPSMDAPSQTVPRMGQPTVAARPTAAPSPSMEVASPPSAPAVLTSISEGPPAETKIIQRAAVDEIEMEEIEELDLAALARRVYPMVKRLIAIERERRPGR